MATKTTKATLTNEELLESCRIGTKGVAVIDLVFSCMGLLVSVSCCMNSLSLLYVPQKDLTRKDILFGLLPWFATPVCAMLCIADRLLYLATHKETSIIFARKLAMLWIFVGTFCYSAAIITIGIIFYVTEDMNYTSKLLLLFVVMFIFRDVGTIHVYGNYVESMDKCISERNLQKQSSLRTKITQNDNMEDGAKGIQNV